MLRQRQRLCEALIVVPDTAYALVGVSGELEITYTRTCKNSINQVSQWIASDRGSTPLISTNFQSKKEFIHKKVVN
jgi:hypothetical protein